MRLRDRAAVAGFSARCERNGGAKARFARQVRGCHLLTNAPQQNPHRSILGSGEGYEAHEDNGAHPRFSWRDLFDNGELL